MIAPVVAGLSAMIIGGFLVAHRPSYGTAVIYILLCLAIIGEVFGCLGRPIPLWAARSVLPERVQLAGYILHEGVSIDLLVSNPEMLVSMPWDEKKAAQLYQADQQARAGQTALMMDLDALAGKPGQGKAGHGRPGNGNPAGTQGTKDAEQPIFYPAPVAALPDKQGD